MKKMHNISLEKVLKNQRLDDAQKGNFRNTLFDCKYSKLEYNKTDTLITSPNYRIHKYEISDDESEDLNKSLNDTTSTDEINESRSSASFHEIDLNKLNELGSEFKKNLSFDTTLKSIQKERQISLTSDEIDDLIYSDTKNSNGYHNYDFQNLSDYDKKFIEFEKTKRMKKFEQAKTHSSKTVSEKTKDSLSIKIQMLKEQQKLLKESLPNILKSPEKNRIEIDEQLEQNLQDMEKNLMNLIKHFKNMQQVCMTNVFEKNYIDNLQSMIQAIETEKSEAKKSDEMSQIEQKYNRLREEKELEIDSIISQHAKEQKEKEQKEIKDLQNQIKYEEEINKYKTKYIEVENFLEHLIKDNLELKINSINNLANKQLNEQVNEFEMSIKSHIKDVDSFINKTFDKHKSVIVAEHPESYIDTIFINLKETLERFIRIGREYENKLSALDALVQNLDKAKEKELLDKQAKLFEEQKRAELIKQKEQETARLEEEKLQKEKQEEEQKRAELIKQKEQETARLEEEKRQKEKQEEERRVADLKKQQEQAATALVNEKKTVVKNVNDNDKNGINNLTLVEFEANRNLFEKLRHDVEGALGDKALKMYKFELQKAINFPLNSLLDDKTNEDNVRNFNEKIRTLIRLLSGQTCSITSTLVVNPTKHPSAINFCLIYLAKKVVEKSEETVSSRPETSFQYVQLIKEVFKQCPQFETILMGQLQEKCPFVVPYYKYRLQNQNDNEYYESLGYKIINNKVEDETLYYKRMNGVLHLYFTLLMNTPNIRNQSPSTNHFTNGYKKAWQWLSDVLNMTPRPDITAEMLAIFFKCCGFQLQRVYGKQFMKLVNVCSADFFQLIKSIPNGKQSGASIGRLQTVFDDFGKNRQFAEWKN